MVCKWVVRITTRDKIHENSRLRGAHLALANLIQRMNFWMKQFVFTLDPKSQQNARLVFGMETPDTTQKNTHTF